MDSKRSSPTLSATKPLSDPSICPVAPDLPNFWNRAVANMVGQSPILGLLCWFIMVGMPSERSALLAELKEQRNRDQERTKEISDSQRVIVMGLKELATEVRFLAQSRRQVVDKP